MKSKNMLIKSVLLLLPLSFASHAQTSVYVSNSDSGHISHYTLNEKSGSLSLVDEIDAGKKAMPTVVSPDKKHLYVAVRQKPYSVVSWDVDAKTGSVSNKTVNLIDTSYAYIALDKSGKYLLGASYDKDVVESYAVNGLKLSEKPVDVYHTGPHAHSVIMDNTNKSLYVGNLGTDKVLLLNLSKDGKISPIGNGFAETAKDNGPRHSVISPDNRFVYNIGEMGGIVTQFERKADGSLVKVSEFASPVAESYKLEHGKERPAGYSDPTPRIWASDLKITPNGKWLYVAERTSSTVAGYKVDKATGKLTLINVWKTEKQPRGIAIDPEGKFLITTGEKSGYISSYAIGKDGWLKEASRVPAGKDTAVNDANWISIVKF